MRLTNINVSNVLGVSSAEITAARPVVLIAGRNGAGKSSIAEAIRQAFTGEPGRGVSAKKDYGKLIRDDAETGVVAIEWAGGSAAIVLPKGERKVEGDIAGDEFLPYCIAPEAFAKMDEAARRTLLFSLTGVRITKDAVKQLLVARGVDMKRAERALPLLASGFEAAQKEAQAKAREAKAAWKTTTGGETWGAEKSAKWEPKPLEVAADKAYSLLANAREKIAEIDGQIEAANEELGAVKATAAARKRAEEQRADLTEKAGRVDRIKAKLERDEAELAEWEKKVDDCKARAGVAPNPRAPGEYLLRGLAAVTSEFLALSAEFPDVDWPADLINRAAAHRAEYVKLHGEPVDEGVERDPEAAAKLPEYEKALALLRSSVANGKRDLEAAQAAGAALAQLADPVAQAAGDTEAIAARVAELRTKRAAWHDDAEKYRGIAEQAKRRDAVSKDAAEFHGDVVAWLDIAEAFAPGGIQAEFLAEAIKPFNDRLAELSELAQWPAVQITDDMQINVGGRSYAFRSESEKWRADAIIAAAIAQTSGLRFVMLDRFDVLDTPGRAEALYWLDDLAVSGVIESAIVLGTLKALPGQLPESIGAAWIEAGVVGEKEAA